MTVSSGKPVSCRSYGQWNHGVILKKVSLREDNNCFIGVHLEVKKGLDTRVVLVIYTVIDYIIGRVLLPGKVGMF